MVREVKSFGGNQKTGEKQERKMEKDKAEKDVDHQGSAEIFIVLSPEHTPDTNPIKPLSA